MLKPPTPPYSELVTLLSHESMKDLHGHQSLHHNIVFLGQRTQSEDSNKKGNKKNTNSGGSNKGLTQGNQFKNQWSFSAKGRGFTQGGQQGSRNDNSREGCFPGCDCNQTDIR